MSEQLAAFAPIEQRTLADVVTVRIREAIFEGKLSPGQRLTEPLLAESLDVSRSPVREALFRLRNEGLITGSTAYQVWNPVESDVDEICSMETMLESMALDWIGDSFTEQDWVHIEALCDEIEALKRDAQVTWGTLLGVVHRFHEYLCRRAGHRRLLKTWREMTGQGAVLISYCLGHRTPPPIDEVCEHFRSILDALRERDLPRAKRLNRELDRLIYTHIKQSLTWQRRHSGV